MRYWTFVYETYDNKGNFSFHNFGPLKMDCHIEIKEHECLVLIGTDALIRSSEATECLKVIACDIACILAFNLNKPIRLKKILGNNPRNLKIPGTISESDHEYKNFFGFKYSLETQNILEAYLEVLNEENDALQYLMAYRLIEMLLKNTKGGTDKKIRAMIPSIPIITSGRGPKHEVTLLTHTRSKIHATDNKYLFPKKIFKQNKDLILDSLTRIIKQKIAAL